MIQFCIIFYINEFGRLIYLKRYKLYPGSPLSVHSFPGNQTHDLANTSSILFELQWFQYCRNNSIIIYTVTLIYNYSCSDTRFWSCRPPLQSTDYFYKSKSTALKRSSLHQTKTFSCAVVLDSTLCGLFSLYERLDSQRLFFKCTANELSL